MKMVSCRALPAALLTVASGLAAPVLAQVQFPSNPTTVQQCEDAHERVRVLAKRYSDRAEQIDQRSREISRQLQAACPTSRDYSRCSAPYSEAKAQLHPQIMQAYEEARRIRNEGHDRFTQCRQVAKAHEQQVAERERIAQENHRRQQQANAENERRQQQAQAEAERARREYEQAQHQAAMQQRAQAERQQREYQAQVQRQQQAIAQQQQAQMAQQALLARQPRVIATPEPSAFNPASRNEPRYVQTPETRAQAAAESQAADRLAALETGKVLRTMVQGAADIRTVNEDPSLAGEYAGKYGAKVGDEVRRGAFDRAMNPEQYKDATVASSVLTAKEANSDINKGRGISPAVTQIQNDAYSAAGSMNNRTMGEFKKSISSLDELSSTSAPAGGYSPPPRSSPAAVQVSSLDELAAVPSPDDACKTVESSFARDQCVVAQCRLTQFREHTICRRLAP